MSLDHHRRKSGLHVPRLQQHRREARLDQPGVQPWRQGSGLQPDPDHRHAKLAEEADQRLGPARHLRLTDDPAGRVDHAYAAPFQSDTSIPA
jgi:hypothetical protein